MLLQLEHQHKKNEEVRAVQKLQTSNSRVLKKQPQPIEQPVSVFFSPQFHQQTYSYNFHTDGLQQLLKQAKVELPPNVSQLIEERSKFCELRVYQAIANTSVDFVSIHLQGFGAGVKHEMQGMFESIHNAVEAGIWDGRYEIAESRKKYFSIAKKEQELLTYITGELVKRNLNELRGEMDQSQSLDVSFTQQRAHSQNHKTKQAESFVKRMQDEQTKHQQNLKRNAENRRLFELKNLEERKRLQQERKMQKHQMMKKKVQHNNQMLEMEKQRRKKMHSQYLKMISSLKKPLFEEKEEKFKKQMMEEQKKKYKMMKELRDQKRSVSFQEIEEHMERYQQLRDEQQQLREQQRQLREHQSQLIREKQPYRSKFYSLVANQNPKIDQKQIKTTMIRKQQDYAEHVKRNFMPKTDQKKQQELEQLIKKVGQNKKHVYHSRKYIEEGKRNLQKLHLLIGELRAKNKLKEGLGLQSIVQSPPVKKYKNYLEDIKQSKITSQTLDFQHQLQNQDEGWVRLQAKRREQRARQKQLYLDNALDTIDIHSHMKGKSVVQHDYIQSAQAKMALLKRYSLNLNQTVEPPQTVQ